MHDATPSVGNLHPAPRPWRPAESARLLLGLLLLFVLRLAYGLTADFWSEDRRQVYLIGLRAYARGEWPYFGPDVVWTASRIPGALQGVLVAAPLRLLALPEAPCLLLNVLSFGALGLLSWVLAPRLPSIPRWFITAWLMTLPWTLNFSTHVVNPSYVLTGSVLFFVGFLEALPALRRGLISTDLAFALMGFGLLWVLQLHLSWVLLPPYLAFALLATLRTSGLRACERAVLAALLGAVPVAALLVPTLVAYGLGGSERNVELRLLDLKTIVTVLAQFLSFGSFELNRFLEMKAAHRLLFLARSPWLVPLVIPLGLVGFAQPVIMTALWFRRRLPWPEWNAVRFLTLATFAWVCAGYFFSTKEPQAHAFYVVFPVVATYSLYCWAHLAQWAIMRRLGLGLLAGSILLHAGIAFARGANRSLYSDRRLVAMAIAIPNDRLLGERRGDAPDPVLYSADPRQDIEVVAARWEAAVFGRVSCWQVTLRNRGTTAAFIDVHYTTRYWDRDDRPFPPGAGVIKELVEPGETREFRDVVDGMARAGAVRAEFEVAAAEPAVPLTPGIAR